MKKPIRRNVDPTVRYSKLTLNGTEYKLAFSFNSIAQAEAVAGLNLMISLDFRNLNAQRYRALLFAAMLKAHPEITLEDAGDLITVDEMDTITEALLEAWGNSITKKGPGEENPPEPELSPAP